MKLLVFNFGAEGNNIDVQAKSIKIGVNNLDVGAFGGNNGVRNTNLLL